MGEFAILVLVVIHKGSQCGMRRHKLKNSIGVAEGREE
jgi:hypothetical protein